MKFIQPRRRAAAGKRTIAKSTRKQRTEKEKEDVKKGVLQVITKLGTVSPMQIRDILKIVQWKVKQATNALIKEKLVDRIGKGKWSRYKRR